MRFFVAAAIFASAGFAAAQSTPAACAAQNIVESCIASTSIQRDACAPNNWDCLCTAQVNVVTCYNNCPGSPDRFGADQQRVAWCNAASAYGTSTKTTATATGSASAATGTTLATSAAAGTPTGTGTRASGTPSPATTSNAAGAVALPAVGGVAALLAGLVGLL